MYPAGLCFRCKSKSRAPAQLLGVGIGELQGKPFKFKMTLEEHGKGSSTKVGRGPLPQPSSTDAQLSRYHVGVCFSWEESCMAREGHVGRGTRTQRGGERNLQQRRGRSPGQVSPGCNLHISGLAAPESGSGLGCGGGRGVIIRENDAV